MPLDLPQLLDSLDLKAKQLQSLLPLDAPTIQALNFSVWTPFEIEIIATSNQMEGNSLTLQETELVLSKGVTISGKPLKDHLEAVNLKAAFDTVKKLASSPEPLSDHQILFLHSLVLSRIQDDWAGRYRSVPVRISGSNHVPPNPAKVPDLMKAWLTSARDSHPVIQAAHDHQTLVDIHPFADGNGRIARLIMNLALLKNGLPPVAIPSDSKSRLTYHEAVESSRLNPVHFQVFLAHLVDTTLDKYLSVLSEVTRENGSPLLGSLGTPVFAEAQTFSSTCSGETS